MVINWNEYEYNNMPKFFHSRDLSFIKTISEEVVDSVIEQVVTLFKMSVGETTTNLYGESLGKVYHEPANLLCIVDREPQSAEYEGMGLDVSQIVEFRFNRQRLRPYGVPTYHELPFLRDVSGTKIPADTIQNTLFGYPETGDIVSFDGQFYEINHIRESKLVGGSSSIYDTIRDQFDDARVEIIAPALLVRNSQVQIQGKFPLPVTSIVPTIPTSNNIRHYRTPIGQISGMNSSFSVPTGNYHPHSLMVFQNGQLFIDSNGIIETNPNSGVFQFENPPNIGSSLFLRYDTTGNGTIIEIPTGNLDGINRNFEVNSGRYKSNTLVAFINGQAYGVGAGIIEIDTSTGIFQFQTPPPSNSVIYVKYEILDGTNSKSEIPVGIINGVNSEFSLNYGSYEPNTLISFVNGLANWNTIGILETDPITGVFSFETPPPIGSTIFIDYVEQL